MDEDVKCVKIKLEPFDEEDDMDPLAPRLSDYKFIEKHFGNHKQFVIKPKLEKTVELKNEYEPSGVSNEGVDDITIDTKLVLKDENLDLPPSAVSEGCIDDCEEGRNSSGHISFQSDVNLTEDNNFVKLICQICNCEASTVDQRKGSECCTPGKHSCGYCKLRSESKQILSHDEVDNINNKLVIKDEIDDLDIPLSAVSESCDDSSANSRYCSRIYSDLILCEDKNLVKKFICQICKFKACTKTTLDQHEYAEHLPSENVRCSHCEFSSESKKNLSRHISTVHCTTSKDYNYIANNKSVSNDHTIAVHKNLSFKCSTKRYTKSSEIVHKKIKQHSCTNCNFSALKISLLKKHVSSVHNIVSFACSQCDFKTHKNYLLKKHVLNVHQRVKHACSDCEYKASTLPILKNHVFSVHNKIKRHTCKKCNYKSNCLQDLEKHVLTSHQSVKHGCNDCEYKASTLPILKNHVLAVHNKAKPYTCSQCEFKSSYLHSLRKHILNVHQRVKPHACSDCDYKASTLSILKNHISAVHKKFKPHTCTQCGYRSSYVQSLKKHVLTVHKSYLMHILAINSKQAQKKV